MVRNGGLALLLLASLMVPVQNAFAAKKITLSSAEKICAQAESIMSRVEDVHYEHLRSGPNEQIQNAGSSAHNDCSGFVSYLLNKFAPTQYELISSAQPKAFYPQAKTYAKYFAELPTNSSGWQKVGSYRELRRGDFIAWAKQTAPGQKAGNTGHIAIVAAPSGEVSEETIDGKTIRYISIKVIDSSSVDHFTPDTLPPHAGQKHRDGLGEGYVRIVLNEQNDPIGYWEGTYWNEGNKPIARPSYTPIIGFARLTNLPD